MQQQMKNMQAQQNGQMMQGNNQMERQGSQMDNMGGPRSGSPGSGDAPSPKRQRLEGNMNQGRPGQPGQMQGNQVGPLSDTPPADPTQSAQLEHTRDLLLRRNIPPEGIPQQQLLNLSMQSTNDQTQSVEIYASSMQAQTQAALNNVKANSNVNKGIPPNMGPGGAQGSPMSQPGMDGATGEFYAAANGGGRLPMQPNAAAAGAAGQAGNNNGNHALQDYQMQLMLLEQQNKKRLLMARQEQDNMTHPAGVGPNGSFPQGMSPQGSQRGGDPSPNPNDMQRGEFQRGSRTVAHLKADTDQGSPTPGGMIDPNQMPPAMRAQMMNQNGQMIRPPSSHPMAGMTPQQIEMMRQQGLPMPNGQFQGQPPQGQMMPGGQPAPGGQPGQPMGTPRQNSQMPPPPAPQANASGTQPSSPSQQPAPPTPNQGTKGKPSGKKDTGKKVSHACRQSSSQTETQLINFKGGNQKKGGAANATPASESEPPPTPTPATPITPMNQNSFNKNQQLPNGQPAPGSAQANAQANNNQNQQQQQQQQSQPPAQQPQQVNAPDLGGAPFGSLDPSDQFAGMPLDFGNLQSDDVLDNFDFDSFLNQDNDMGFGFDANVFGDALDAGGIEGAN